MPNASISPTQIEYKETKTKESFVFVLQLHDGRYVIGAATNPSRRIASINSGHSRFIPQALQVNRCLGIRPVNEDRNLMTVVNKFATTYGDDKVLVV